MKKIYRFQVNEHRKTRCKGVVSVEAGTILEAKDAIKGDYPMAMFMNIKLKGL